MSYAIPISVVPITVSFSFSSDPSSLLPPTIDGTVAVSTFRRKRDVLLNLIRHCLPSLPNALYSGLLIPEDIKEDVCNPAINRSERTTVLLDCLQDSIEADSLAFAKVVNILHSEPYLSSQAKDLVKEYCECITVAMHVSGISIQACK